MGLRILVILCYLFVNSLFVLKYGSRQKLIPVYSLVLGYSLFIVLGIITIGRLKNWLNNFQKFNLLLLIVSVLTLVGFLIINIVTDAESLNVDRWSALESFIRSILEGEYPYSVQDHLGQTSSNFYEF